MTNSSNTYFNSDGIEVEDTNPESTPIEMGFWHPDIGYWQTITAVNSNIIQSYPEGTIEVPIRPGPNYDWNGTEWVISTRPLYTNEQIKAMRNAAYLSESDPLFFKWQRNEIVQEEWLAKVQEIRDRFPYNPE